MVVPISLQESSVSSKTPSAPPLSPQHATGQEDGVHFIVGAEKHDFYIRGILLTMGCLAVLIRQKNRLCPGSNIVTLGHVKKEGFEMLMKDLKGENVTITTTSQALIALETSVLCNSTSLCKLAVTYCDLNLSKNTVLNIIQTIFPLRKQLHLAEELNYFDNPDMQDQRKIKTLINQLCFNCEIIFDNSANELLQSQEFFTMDMEIAKDILCTDIYISNELLLWNVVQRWCDKFLFDKTPKEQREILKEILCRIRYGLMKEDEFINGPGDVTKFSFDDLQMNNHLEQMRKMRVPNQKIPYNLSLRSQSDVGRSISPKNSPKINKEKVKKEKNPPKILLVLLRCWQIVFD